MAAVPGSWKGTRAKLYRGLFGLLRDVSKILDAPSMTWTRSSYMEPVTSKTNARVDAPSGISSFVAPLGASCAAQSAADSARVSHTSLEPISLPGCYPSYFLDAFFLKKKKNKKTLNSRTSALRHRALRCALPAAVVRFLWSLGAVCARRSRSLSPLCELKPGSPSSCRSGCCLRSQEPLFSPVIQRPPLSWAKNPPRRKLPHSG